MTKESIIQKLQNYKDNLLEKYPIKSLGIFGSYSRGDNNLDSDIDILVEFNGRIGIEFLDLED